MRRISIRNRCRSHYRSNQIEAWATPKQLEQYERLIRELIEFVVDEGTE
jgi:hypothetical protein